MTVVLHLLLFVPLTTSFGYLIAAVMFAAKE